MDGVQLSQGTVLIWEFSLLFTLKYPENPSTHLIDLGQMKGCESTLEPPSGFEFGTPGLGIQCPNQLAIAQGQLGK